MRRLAEWASSVEYADLPDTVRTRAGLVLADSVGVIVNGSRAPEVRALRERNSGTGDAEMLSAVPGRGDAAAAAFVNAFAMGSIEMDEGSRPSGHPALHVVPAVLAAAQEQRSSGAEVLAALVVGYEVQARLQWATTIRPEVHPHGNFGHVGAAAALARLAKMGPSDMAEAVCMAAGLAAGTSWRPALTGAGVRNAYAGQSAQTALRVIQLVAAGVRGYPDAPADTFGTILGTDFRPAALDRALGDHFVLLSGFVKFHSSCVLIHPVIDALADAFGVGPIAGTAPLVRLPEPVDPDDVALVEIWVPRRSLKLDVPDPVTPLGGRFSIPFAAASFLANGNAMPESFEGERLNDPATRALAARVVVQGSTEMETRWPQELVSRVRIRLVGGRSLHGECVNPVGTDERTLTEPNLRAKFEYLASAAGLENAAAHWQRLLRFHERSSLTDLLDSKG